MNKIYHVLNSVLGTYSKKYNADWSDKLEFILDNYTYAEVSDFDITFSLGEDELSVWTSNKFYSYGYLYSINGVMTVECCKFRPSYRVMKRLHEIEINIRNLNQLDMGAKLKSDLDRIIGDS